MTRYLQQAAYVLHTRDYRETSLIVDFFTREFGIVAVVAKGCKRGKINLSSTLQAFNLLSISWSDHGTLGTLINAEFSTIVKQYSGKIMFCLLYINELINKLLIKHDPHEGLFDLYSDFIINVNEDNLVVNLRIFEKKLLQDIGYALPFDEAYDYHTRQKKLIEIDKSYLFAPDKGFIELSNYEQGNNIYQGFELLAIKDDNYCQPNTLAAAKRLNRQCINFHLAGKQINSRDLIGVFVK